MRHAIEMINALGAQELYRYIGGEPPSMKGLQAQYERQSRGQSPDGKTGWLNWIVRDRTSDRAIGFVQSSLSYNDGALIADIAWLITPSEQGRGAAVEASSAVLDWLRTLHPRRIRALIHPDHAASARVAERLGLARTSALVGGETVWETAPIPSDVVKRSSGQ
ncbi:RimJ/RimL family protein N-acetyltransferase [Arthrobacter sp. CAN_A6]